MELLKRTRERREQVGEIINESALPCTPALGPQLCQKAGFSKFCAFVEEWHVNHADDQYNRQAFVDGIDSCLEECLGSISKEKWAVVKRDFVSNVIYCATDAHERVIELGRREGEGELKQKPVQDPLSRKYMCLLYDSWRYGTFLWGGNTTTLAKWWHSIQALGF